MMTPIAGGHYILCDDEILGEGAFGEVKVGYRDNTKLAIKRLVKSKLSPTMREHLKMEVDVMRRCRHPGVVPLRDVVETDDEVYFVMDYLNGGDLFDLVVSRGKLEEPLACHVFGQLAEVVDYLHNHLSVIHHDIKLENVLVHHNNDPLTNPNNQLTVKLSDFGLCCTVQRPSDVLTKFSGTEAYCSPEVLEGRPYSGGANEIYALGVVLYIAVTGSYPYDPEIELQVEQQTDYGHLSSLPFPRDVSRECRDLVLTMLDPNPRKRPTIELVLAHPFLQPYFAALKKQQQQSQYEDGCEEEINACEVSVADEEEDVADDADHDHALDLSVMVYDEEDDDLDTMLQ